MTIAVDFDTHGTRILAGEDPGIIGTTLTMPEHMTLEKLLANYDSYNYKYTIYPLLSIDSAESEYPELFI
jgi:hypothetical protein